MKRRCVLTISFLCSCENWRRATTINSEVPNCDDLRAIALVLYGEKREKKMAGSRACQVGSDVSEKIVDITPSAYVEYRTLDYEYPEGS